VDAAETQARLDALINYEVVPRAGAIDGLTLEPMRNLMASLGDPQLVYPVIHITGTNGKGSSVRMIEALLQTMGLRVGTYTSPHLEAVNERIRCGGDAIDDADLTEVLATVFRSVDGYELPNPTWFEVVTAAAFVHFANEAVDVAVVEVGMLGRFDATNVVEANVAAITNVGQDHTSGQGQWRAEIAREKAGIITPGCSLVLGESDDELVQIVASEPCERSLVRGADFDVVENLLAVGGRLISLRTPLASYDEVFLALHGAHQADNAALALTVVETFFASALGSDVVSEAFGSVEVPGRLEIVHRNPTVLLDAAHNPPGAEVLAETLDGDFGQSGRRFLLLGMQDGRDPVALCRALRVGDFHLVATCTTPTARGIDAVALADAVRSAGGNADPVADPEAAFDHLLNQCEDDDLLVIAGSISTIGALRSLAAGL